MRLRSTVYNWLVLQELEMVTELLASMWQPRKKAVSCGIIMLIYYAWHDTNVSVEGSIWSDNEGNNDYEDDHDDAVMTSLKP